MKLCLWYFVGKLSFLKMRPSFLQLENCSSAQSVLSNIVRRHSSLTKLHVMTNINTSKRYLHTLFDNRRDTFLPAFKTRRFTIRVFPDQTENFSFDERIYFPGGPIIIRSGSDDGILEKSKGQFKFFKGALITIVVDTNLFDSRT